MTGSGVAVANCWQANFVNGPVATIIYRDEAEDDLANIWRYVAQHDAAAADRLIADIQEATDRLIDHPLSASDWAHLRPGLRKLTVGNYGVFHRVIGDDVVIQRVLHMRRDFGAIDF